MEIRDEIPSLLMMCQENDTGTAAPVLMEESPPRVPHHSSPAGPELGIQLKFVWFIPKLQSQEATIPKWK